MKKLLTKRNVKRLLLVLAALAVAFLVVGCAPTTGANGKVNPISHTSGSWWDRWVVFYISQFLLWMAKQLGNSYGWTIILFTILVRVIVLPLSAISINSTKKMQKLQPQIEELKKKYPGKDVESRQALNEETNKLYKEAGVNPAAGCLPLLIQMPFMIALYSAIARTPELQAGHFLWMDLGSYDPYYVLPILAAGFTFLSTWIAQLSTPQTDAAGATKSMMYVMPLIIGVSAIRLQSAITLYWVISNLFQVLQTLLLQNPFTYQKELKEQEEQERSRKRKLSKAYKKYGYRK